MSKAINPEYPAYYAFGKLHISQLIWSGLLWYVQCLQVHMPPVEPMGGSGLAVGPTYDVWRDTDGEGAEIRSSVI